MLMPWLQVISKRNFLRDNIQVPVKTEICSLRAVGILARKVLGNTATHAQAHTCGALAQKKNGRLFHFEVGCAWSPSIAHQVAAASGSFAHAADALPCRLLRNGTKVAIKKHDVILNLNEEQTNGLGTCCPPTKKKPSKFHIFPLPEKDFKLQSIKTLMPKKHASFFIQHKDKNKYLPLIYFESIFVLLISTISRTLFIFL